MTATIQQLDPETEALLDGFGQMWEALSKVSLEEKRLAMRSQEPWAPLEDVHSCYDVDANGVSCRIVRPTEEENLPTLIYFHRGGWVLGSVDESERVCREIANRFGAVIVSVEYPLAPEHPYPAAFEASVTATEWALQNIGDHGGDPERVGVIGESAGGGLAAAVSLRLREKVWCQLLLYPILTCRLIESAYEGCLDKHLITLENMRAFVGAYVANPADRDKPYASPLLATELERLPRAFILTAEFDPLHVEGAQYTEKLQAAGVDCELLCVPGAIHGFLDLPIREQVRNETWNRLTTWLKST